MTDSLIEALPPGLLIASGALVALQPDLKFRREGLWPALLCAAAIACVLMLGMALFARLLGAHPALSPVAYALLMGGMAVAAYWGLVWLARRWLARR